MQRPALRNSLLVLWMVVAIASIAHCANGQTSQAQQSEAAANAGHQVLVRHCIECHGETSAKGKLNLSHRETALSGGKRGASLVPGKASESLVWQHVESQKMPPKSRPRLSLDEQQALRDWIYAGAAWPNVPLAAANASPTATWIRRLTIDEYIETVRAAVAVDIETEARRLLPRDLRADGFSNTSYNLQVDLSHIGAYAALAEMIAARANVEKLAAEFARAHTLDDTNVRALVASLGEWLLRGPLDESEINAFVPLAAAVAEEKGDFSDAVRLIVEAMLQSPRFIYRIERESAAGPRELSPHERATRLSYALWGAPPDKELLRAATAGDLAQRTSAERQVRRMLADPRAQQQSRRFMHEWMDLERLASLQPDRERFPQWNEQLAADMRDETLAVFHEIAWQEQRPLTELLSAPFTYATPRLAAHYGFAPELATGVPQERRAALATQRAAAGLQAMYFFDEGSGNVVRDTSTRSDPLDLTIETPSATNWTDEGLVVSGPTIIAADRAPTRLIDAIKKSKALTLEAWLTPADAQQKGPARIVTLSSGIVQRNVSLGQEKEKLDVRLRSTRTDANGMPSLSSGGVAAGRRVHVAFTREPSGKTSLYVDGRRQSEGRADGDFANWDSGYRLVLANETSVDRPWRGTLYLVAIYDRALAPAEIEGNFKAGPRPDTSPVRYDLASVRERRGLLTHGSTLTIGGDEGSMVTRGLFILGELLYTRVEDPPPCVDTTPVPTKPGQSQRTLSEQRIANRACVGCHAQFEPLAFGLERFDGIGGYRLVDEHGNKLREDGSALLPEREEPIPYATTAELMKLLSESPRVRKGIARKLTQFTIGRPLAASDAPLIDRIDDVAHRDGFTYAALLQAIVSSKLVLDLPEENVP